MTAPTYLNLMRLASTLDRAGFAQHAPPNLLLIEAREGGSTTTFETAIGRGGMPLPGDPVVRPLSKRPGANVFSNMITIGRAPNNDLILNDASVSKFHAYFMLKDGAPHLVDAGATNPTRIAGVALAPNEPTPLTESAKVMLGDIETIFFTSSGLYDYLRSSLD